MTRLTILSKISLIRFKNRMTEAARSPKLAVTAPKKMVNKMSGSM